jgi:chemotaxis protein MotB
MQSNGLGEQQVAQVRGYADQLPRKGVPSDDPSNRRMSLIVQYTVKPGQYAPTSKDAAGATAGKPADTKGAPASAPPQTAQKPAAQATQQAAPKPAPAVPQQAAAAAKPGITKLATPPPPVRPAGK